MLIAEIFDYLNYGALSQVSLGDSNASGISEESYPALVSHLNIALLELHKRFPLRMREVDIKLNTAITEYKIEAMYSIVTGIVSPETPVLYLLDTLEKPFINKLLRIERVFTSNADIEGEYPLNDYANSISLYTNAFNYLTVVSPNDTDILTIHYRAAPTRVAIAKFDPDTQQIHIPETLVEPLLYYIAHRVHGSIASIDGNTSEATMYLQKFETSIRQIKIDGLIENINTTSIHAKTNGWV